MNQIINKNIFWYLCASIPLTFTLGIAITEIFVLISIIFFFYENRDFKYIKDKNFLYLFLFSIYIAINSITQISYDDLKSNDVPESWINKGLVVDTALCVTLLRVGVVMVNPLTLKLLFSVI